jgi:hypothetical protein
MTVIPMTVTAAQPTVFTLNQATPALSLEMTVLRSHPFAVTVLLQAAKPVMTAIPPEETDVMKHVQLLKQALTAPTPEPHVSIIAVTVLWPVPNSVMTVEQPTVTAVMTNASGRKICAVWEPLRITPVFQTPAETDLAVSMMNGTLQRHAMTEIWLSVTDARPYVRLNLSALML